MGEIKNSYKISVGKHEGKRPLGRHRRTWEDVRMDLMEIVWEGVEWMHLAQDSDR
jgi:cell wall assembly regulator SMI1